MNKMLSQETSMKNFAEQFRIIDTNHDGNIDKDELIANILYIVNYTDTSEQEINELFEKLDENKNGLIEYSEFITAFMTKELTLHSDNLRKAFDALD